MERTTFNLLFYIRRTKLNKAGEAPVFMRLTIDGTRAEASVKHSIRPQSWNTAKGREYCLRKPETVDRAHKES